MSTWTVDYTGEMTSTQGHASTPLQAANQLIQGYIPSNLVDASSNQHFRDATLGYALRDVTDHNTLLNALCSALRSSINTTDVLRISEYTAAVAYSFGHPDLAVKAIARNEVTSATPHIWAVAQAMSKRMPGPFYQSLLVSQLAQAEENWNRGV